MTLASAAADLLLAHGPLTLAELHELAVAQGLTKAKTPSAMRSAFSGEQFVARPDGRFDTAARILRGQVFTTRTKPNDDGVLWTYRDLDGLMVLPRLWLATGGELTRGAGDVECWTGPPSWWPETTPSQLIGLRWNGEALDVTAVDEAPAGDSDVVRAAREVLARHARSQHRYGWSSVPRTSLTTTVLSALVEDPSLFTAPLPPLRELLPLPEDLRPTDDRYGRDPDRHAVLVEVPLPTRVHQELTRRADLIGEHFPDYLALLLGAAADRVQLAPPSYDRYAPYDGSYSSLGGDVIRLDGRGR